MILGIIPARYDSSRFPGKPLVNIQGKTMIERVYQQCAKADRLDKVIVATDDERIFRHVQGFSGHVMMTKGHHISGTERIGEVAKNFPEYDHCINIQGDEPYIDPRQIDLLCETLADDPAVHIATLVKRTQDKERAQNPNSIKVVVDHNGDALYFSRSLIPFYRNLLKTGEPTYLQHIGIYGFTREILLKIPQMKPSELETAESLEQLRWMANGYKIRTAETDMESHSIDTPEDLHRLLEGR
ncbi:3-deoxy-manno-octulosonate cytidylyltransferase [bacterium]|nr:3-deoxy-manno-octulosonate cytidylyltransferase [bacterium]